MATLPIGEAMSPVGRPRIVGSRLAEQVHLMRESDLFACLSESECMEIAGSARTRTFARNEQLFMEGQPILHVLLLWSGCVKLTQLSSSGREVILWLNGSGAAIGVHGPSAGGVHTCSARVVEECRALVWDYSRLESLLTGSPRISRNISRMMTERVIELQERFREISTEKVAQRVALALVRLVKQMGCPFNGGMNVTLSREELAQMSGTTLFTVSRLISKWEQLGLVTPRKEAVLVRDLQRLEQVGEGN